MGKITLEEFKELGKEEQCKRYKDMSNEDKYIFRISDPVPFLNAETVGHMEVTEEQKKMAKDMRSETIQKVNNRLKELEKNE